MPEKKGTVFDEIEHSPEAMKMPNLLVSPRFIEAEKLISPVPVSEPGWFPLKTICIAFATELRFGASGRGRGRGRGRGKGSDSDSDYYKKKDSFPCTRIRPRLGPNLHIRSLFSDSQDLFRSSTRRRPLLSAAATTRPRRLVRRSLGVGGSFSEGGLEFFILLFLLLE